MFRLFVAAFLPSLVALVMLPSLAFSEGKLAPAPLAAQNSRRTPDATVTLVKGSLSAATVTVQAGQTVRWENRDDRDYSLVATDPESPEFKAFRSGVIKPGGTWDYRFEREGVFQYHCSIRPRVRGSVSVVAPENGGA